DAVLRDVDELPGLDVLDVAEAAVRERDALRGRRKEVPVHRVAKRAETLRIASEDEIAASVEEDDRIGAIDDLRDPPEDLRVIAFGAVAQAVGDVVHEELGVGLPHQVIALGLEIVTEMIVVRDVAVEPESEPLVHAAVM